MSPNRRQQFVPSRPRSEVITAVAVAVGIVVGTALLIWLIRPGPTGVPGGGGLFSRQPRMTILILLTAIVLASVTLFVLRRHQRPRFGTRGAIAVGTTTVVVLAVVGGIFWPGGVVRHWPKQPKIATPPSTNAITPASTVTPATTAKSGTTVKPSTATTVKPATATTVKPSSAPSTTAGG